MPDAPRTGNEAAAFLRRQHDNGTSWRGKCLALQRTARGLPSVYPSALSAAIATPKSERVARIEDLKRGMVAYSDDPHDGNPFGHIYFILGRTKAGLTDRKNPAHVLTWSNDVISGGRVGLVPLTFFRSNWGDGFQFGATWLNGYDFHEFDKPAKPATKGRVHLADNYRHAIEDVEKELRRIKGTGHPRIVAALQSDLAKMRKTLKAFD